jgi:cyclohexanecarboxyl-CoA dehydrogenase
MAHLWMDQDTSEEERLFRETIRRFTEEVVNPLDRESRRDYIDVSRKLHVEAGKRGILGLSIPERYGGQGGSAMMQGIAREELGRALVIGYGLPFPLLATHIVFAEKGSQGLLEKWMPRLLAGEAKIGIASTEPKSGCDLATITTSAVREGDRYILNGEKGPMSHISGTDAWIVLARTGGLEAGSRGVTEFFVEADRPGVEKYHFDAMEESADLGGVRFANVELPADHIVGEENMGFGQQLGAFDIERVILPMAYLGAAMHSVELSIEYSKSRVVWGRPIASFEGVMFPLVEAVTKIESVRSFCYEVLRRYDRGEQMRKESSMARWYVTRVALDALDTCIQVNGAQGYTDTVPHQRRYRWVRAGLFGHGTQEIQKLIIGREIMGKEVYNLALGRTPAGKERTER